MQSQKCWQKGNSTNLNQNRDRKFFEVLKVFDFVILEVVRNVI